jgi:general secretion pathway protein D
LRARAKEAEKAGDSLRAYLLYSQAAGSDPRDVTSWSRAMALQTRALDQARYPVDGKTAPFTPGSGTAGIQAGATEPAASVPDVGDLAAARYLSAPLRLSPNPGKRSFDLRGDTKTICEQALKAYGIEVIFDGDLQPQPNLRFRIADADFGEAADSLQLATGTFIVPIGRKMAMVAKDAANKRQELEHTIAIAIPLPNTTSVQEAQELARAVQSIMEIQKFGVDPNQRLVVIRDRESKVLPALALFNDMVRHRAQITVDVELLETSNTSDLSLGFRLPTEFPMIALKKLFNTAVSYPAGIANFVTFGGGASFLGLGLADSRVFGTFAKGNGRSLNRAQIRGVDGQAMNFHLGDKYPVMTAGYFGDTGGATGQTYTPPPTFNFEDLGVVIKITPHVHGAGEISLEIEAEYKVLTGQALNGIPVISSRSFKASARLAAGETAVIAGLMRASEARTVTGIAGLSQIPALGHLFRHETRTKDDGQALLAIRPHLINLPPSTDPTRTVYTGTDGRPRIPI